MSGNDSAKHEIVTTRGSSRPAVDPALSAQLAELHLDSWGWALTVADADRSEAEEVLQVTYVRVLDGSARFRGHSLFKTWLFGVIRNVAAERRRRRAKEAAKAPEERGAPCEEASNEESPADSLARSLMSSRLRSALGQLSERQGQVLHLVFYQEMTIAEAAEVLGISFGSARTHYERGKRNLRGLLEGGEADR